ncbi:MAG TPA: dynamin family protein, partial [Streptosporangiaceae bacterium]
MSEPAATSAAADLGRSYQLAVNQALDEFRAAGRPDLVDEVAGDVRRPRPDRPVVLVAGETKRGKSSLVNALVRRPGLSPTGVDIATTAYLVFRHGAQPLASVATLVGGQPQRRQIEFDEIGDWATSEGNLGNARQVLGVEVALPTPLLGSLTIVDTPGRGGLESVNGAVSVPAARQADAIIFVLDAGSPVAAPELAFLREATASVDAVLIVIAKTDDYPGW